MHLDRRHVDCFVVLVDLDCRNNLDNMNSTDAAIHKFDSAMHLRMHTDFAATKAFAASKALVAMKAAILMKLPFGKNSSNN